MNKSLPIGYKRIKGYGIYYYDFIALAMDIINKHKLI